MLAGLHVFCERTINSVYRKNKCFKNNFFSTNLTRSRLVCSGLYVVLLAPNIKGLTIQHTYVLVRAEGDVERFFEKE